MKIFTGDHRAVAADMCRTLGLQGQVLGAEALPDLTAQELAEATTLGVEYGPLLGSAVAFAQARELKGIDARGMVHPTPQGNPFPSRADESVFRFRACRCFP